MNMNFTNLNTQYSAEIISAIAAENSNSAKSNISSVYGSKSTNIDAAVLSISGAGSVRINAMMSKSIQLRASASNPELTAAERQALNSEIKDLRRQIDNLKSDAAPRTASIEASHKTAERNAKIETENPDQMIEKNFQNILHYAEDSIMTQNVNRDHVLQLL